MESATVRERMSPAALCGWAAVALATAAMVGCHRRPPPPPADAVALVGGRPILQADLHRQLQRLPAALRSRYAQPEYRHELLESIVGTELLALEAERQGFQGDPEYQNAVKQQLVNHFLSRTLDPLTTHEARGRRMQALLAESRNRFKVEILDPQLSVRSTATQMTANHLSPSP
jgi:hypothetical protein